MRTPLPHPRVLPIAFVAAAVLLVPIPSVAAPVVAASPWLPARTIAIDALDKDAAGRGSVMAVAYRTAAGVGVAISSDAGTTFRRRLVSGPGVNLAGPVQVATCRGDALVLTQERTPAGVLQLRLARVPGTGGPITRVTIRRGVAAASTADLGCGPDRAVVGWTQPVGGAWTAFLREVRLPDLGAGRVRDLGAADRLGVAVAVATDAVVAAVAGPGGTAVWRIPLAPVGSPADPVAGPLLAGLRRPVLAADGRSVALGGRVAGLTWIRTSTDGARSFSTGTPFTGGTLGSLAVRARWVAATLVAPAPVGTGSIHRRAYSDDRGVSWKLATLALGPVAAPLMAFVSTPGGVRLTETWTTGTADPGAPHDVLFHRHA